MRPANAKLVLDRGITLVVGGIAGYSATFMRWPPLFEEAFGGGALLFGVNEFTGSLSRQLADKFPKAGIGLRRFIRRHVVSGCEDDAYVVCRCPFPLCQNTIVADERTIPFQAKIGPAPGGFECEIARMSATSSVVHGAFSVFKHGMLTPLEG